MDHSLTNGMAIFQFCLNNSLLLKNKLEKAAKSQWASQGLNSVQKRKVKVIRSLTN